MLLCKLEVDVSDTCRTALGVPEKGWMVKLNCYSFCTRNLNQCNRQTCLQVMLLCAKLSVVTMTTLNVLIIENYEVYI